MVGNEGLIIATDYSRKSLRLLRKNLRTKNVKIKCISMDDIPKIFGKKNIMFDKIISSYALYYAKNPLKIIKKCSKYLKTNGSFLITVPCYPHTLTKFALNEKTLPAIAKKYIDFSSKKISVFLRSKKYKKKIYNFQNILRFSKITDLLEFYRSTVFYNRKSEKKTCQTFELAKKKSDHFKIIKSAKLYMFQIK